jgi:glycosyltransferase involved in cell wall biosynthesis
VKVAFCLLSLTGHGIGVVTARLAAELHRRGHEVILLCSVPDEEPPEGPVGVEVRTVGSARARDHVAPLVRLLRRSRPDVVVSTHVKYTDLCALAIALSATATPLVAVEHTQLSHELRHWGTRRAHILRALAVLAYRRAGAVVGVSRAVADDLADQLALRRDRVEVIYNAVLAPGALALGPAGAAAPHAWLEGDLPVIVAAGRLSPAKDHATLLEAFALLRRHVDARLVVLGEGPLRRSLEQRRDQLGLGDVVLLPGAVARPQEWFRHASVVASSSTWEGLPTALVEALAAGAPVVGTDAGGTRELLDGGLGTVVPVADPRALAAALRRALHAGPAPAAARTARLEPFTVAQAATRYESLLSRVTGAGT